MKQLTVENIEIDSIWQSKKTSEWRVQIQRIQQDEDGTRYYYKVICSPDYLMNAIGSFMDKERSHFLSEYKPVYMVEGFEV